MLSLTQFISLFGQKKMIDSLPVVIASDQSAIRVNVQSLPTSIPVIIPGTVAATQSGIWNITNITGTVSLPTGASTSALQTAGNASLVSIDSKLTSPITITGTVAATQSGVWTTGRTWTLASGTDSVAAVQSGTWNINNITGTVSLPTGASTSALQTTGNTSLASIDSKLTSPITVTGTVAATQSGTWNINNISGTISLPTGAATEASLAKLTLAQASTTAGQSGPLIQAAVTTAAPAYTTGQTSPLSLTTGGALRVFDTTATNSSSTGTSTTVSVSTASVQLLAANTARKGFSIVNGGSSTLYVALGFTPTTVIYTMQIGTTAATERYEMYDSTYTGVVNAIRNSGTSNVYITELT